MLQSTRFTLLPSQYNSKGSTAPPSQKGRGLLILSLQPWTDMALDLLYMRNSTCCGYALLGLICITFWIRSYQYSSMALVKAVGLINN